MTSTFTTDPSLSNSYHAHHSPLGAFATFTVGFAGATGGFGHALRGAARQNVYVGYRVGQSTWQMLPFYVPPRSKEAAFTGEAGTVTASNNVLMLPESEFSRDLKWASDTWRAAAGRFGFSLLSPFDKVPEPSKLRKAEARLHLSPHINGWLEYDNSSGTEPVELMFGLGEPDGVFRPLVDSDPNQVGFALGTQFAYATALEANAEARQGFSVFEPKFRDYHGLCVIGSESALVFTVPPGQKLRFPLVFAFYQDGVATTGIRTQYAYTRYFDGLGAVIRHALAAREHYEATAQKRDAELAASKLSEEQRFLVAHATHSYLGNTQLLWGDDGPIWVVNEGEYRMMNTFDLTVDLLFFELEWIPWAVRNVLDQFATRYAYQDHIYVDGESKRGGLSFTHDMGVNNNFTPPGRSSYECDHLTGCFSHMTMEQLLNWIICAAGYGLHGGDTRWLKKQKRLLKSCAESLRRRDNPNPKLRNGIPKFDSMRCGTDGAEITTYDSLDVSLGQARNNLYLSCKALGAWVLLEAAFDRIKEHHEARAAGESAELLARTLTSKFDITTNTFPAVFEGDNVSRIIPAIEGFVYPLFLGLDQATDKAGRFAPLLAQLSLHVQSILQPGICLDEQSGAWKMSSTSNNTWFSKIAIAQYVVRQLFPEALTPAARASDRVHAQFQRSPSCGAHAMCDQLRSDTGETCGSRYYPRGVSASLWLSER